MSFFSSKRERGLWLGTLLVVAAIYATLGLTGMLLESLIELELFGAAFLIAFIVIWVGILTQGLRVRPGGIEIGLALGVAAAYLMVFSRLGIAERSHLFEYSVVAVFLYEALAERAKNGRRVPVPALLAIGGTALVGTLDEAIQALLPSRVFDPIDMGFNALAAFLAVGAMVVLGWARRWGGKVRSYFAAEPRESPPTQTGSTSPEDVTQRMDVR